MTDEDFMQLALEQAREAATADEAPVGAVIVRDGIVLAAARNEREALRDPTARGRSCRRAFRASFTGRPIRRPAPHEVCFGCWTTSG
jgi:tRNA(Arg) A34 adenosine deaminase TadA